MRHIVIHIKSLDQRGIISLYTEMLSSLSINILKLEQHVEPDDKLFFMRIEAELLEDKTSIEDLKDHLSKTDSEVDGNSKVFDKQKKQNIAILVTKESLPLYDILIKNQTQEINSNIKTIISNHKVLEPISDQFDIEFRYLDLSDKSYAEKELLSILDQEQIDLIILARYMQIISADIVSLYRNNIINIHHGFLPAFKGAKPYHQAYKKGVKIIGATSHYVTNKLDEGPIITQDVVHINHSHSVKDMIQLGREIERTVLYKSVKAHLEYRIIINNNKTIVFK